MKKNLLFNSILFVVAAVFTISLYAMIIQLIPVASDNKATIIAGVLGMIGGFAGAMGAFLAALHQINTQQLIRDEEMKKNSRPMINCTELHNVNEDLSNIKYSDFAILLSDISIFRGSKLVKCPFYVIQFIGSFKIVINVEITILMDDGVERTYPIGGIKQDNEILLRVPITEDETSIKSEGSTDKIIISYITEKQEKIKYVYDNTNLNERYYLVENGNELLLDKFDFKAGTWQIPGRYNLD
ncbi:MAG TPA: hypothetical protein DDY89_15245 [Lysinibacillus sp.]|nr:hypothetical protein [Lysinibacillus sp.]